MHDMERMEDYRDDKFYRNYRDDYSYNYRDDYRNYRNNYRRGNYRDRYGRNYRSQEDYTMMLEDITEDSMELARAFEDVSDMITAPNEKQKFMKMAEREKEHYRTVKEMLQNKM